MEAGIITPKTGVTVDRKESRKKLTRKKNNKRNVERGAGEDDFSLKNHLHEPRSRDNNYQNINQHHLVIFKQLKVPRRHHQGNEKKEGVERIFNHLIANFGNIHANSLAKFRLHDKRHNF